MPRLGTFTALTRHLRVVLGLASALVASTATVPGAVATGSGPAYPRLANIYLHGAVDLADIPALARWDVLVLDTVWSSADLQRLRALHPDIKLYFYVCSHCLAVSPPPTDSWRQLNYQYALDNDLWWRNADGSVASDWPGTAMLNMTDRAPEAPQGPWRRYMAKRIENLVTARPELDGVFLDNFWKAISWEQGGAIRADSDCNPTHNPAGCNGVQDAPGVLDSLWNQALRSFARDVRDRFDAQQARREDGATLAILTNGAGDYFPWVNGTMYEHFPSRHTPADLGNPYGYNWIHEMREMPSGYLVAPFRATPYTVQILNAAWEGSLDAPQRSPEFERHKRFTLVSALLGDGYYSLDADSGHGSLWWEPEFDGGGLGKGYLGYPLGPMRRIGAATGQELVTNGSYTGTPLPWKTFSDRCIADYRLDNTVYHSAPSSGRIDVATVQSGGSFKLYQSVPVFGGTPYTLTFWAKASVPQEVVVHLYSSSCIDDRCLGDQSFRVGTSWTQYDVSFMATGHAQAGLNLFVKTHGVVWVDDISLRSGDTNIYRRDFDRGIVLLNYTTTQRVVPLETAMFRLRVPGSPVWDGAAVMQEIVPPSDGRILLRTPRPTDAEPPSPDGDKRHGIRLHNDPNPGRPMTAIRFTLTRDEHVRLAIYDVAGRRIRTLIDSLMRAGSEQVVRWDAKDDAGNRVKPGVYVYRLQTPSGVESRKTVVAM